MKELIERFSRLNEKLNEKKIEYGSLQKQKETIDEEMDKITKDIQEKFGITPDKMCEMIDQLRGEVVGKLDEIEKKLKEIGE